MGYTGTVIIIPTRNRPDLVRNALASVLGQSDCEVEVLVSDNSTSSEDQASLSQYCQELQNKRLRYIAPPEPLPMSQHWNWALEQALSLYNASHFTFLTDRMVFKPDALRSLIPIITAHPDRVVSYMHDKVLDFAPPYKVHQNDWTGKLYEVATARLLKLSAESVMYDACIPRMLNCVVPRITIEAIKARFGNVFSSLAPDWNFAYRVLELLDSILFLHKALLVHYSQVRSNGENVNRGISDGTYGQYLKDLPTPMNIDAPYPEIITVWNAVINEYVFVKKESGSAKFPNLNMKRYSDALAFGIKSIEGAETRKKMSDMLRARGWKPSTNALRQLSLAAEMMNVRQVLSILRSLANPSRLRTFETPERALEFAITRTKPAQKIVWDEALHQGFEVPTPYAPALHVADSG
jgi:glycosyltransferase involved in cell wall biosynthesis